MVQDAGKLFVNAPNTLDENRVSVCDTADAKFQSEETGLVDGVGTEEEVLEQIRRLLVLLPSNNEDELPCDLDNADDLPRIPPYCR